MQQEEAIHGETETAVETPVPGEAIENGASDEETVAASEEEAPVAEAEVVEPPAEAAQEAVAQEAAPQEAATQEVTTQEVDAQEAAPQEAVAEEADAQGADAEVAPAEAAEAAEAAVAEVAVAEAEPEAGAASEPLTMEDWLDQVERVEEESAIHRGDIVEGEIVQTSPTEILIDVGAKAEGVISGRELERMDRQTLETLQPGSKVLVYVLNPEGRSGHPVLSLSRAQEEQDWRQAEEYRESQDVYEGKIAGYNKGGLIVRFGKVRGFVPASQISVERRRQSSGATPEERWADMIGDSIMVKVVEVDRPRNRLILSERAATREWRAKQKEALLDELQVGEKRTGRVISLTDFGVFVDLGGADGLVHMSELTWRPVNHPKEVVKVGQKVTVQVISVDRERRRIGLSLKQLEEDPWDRIAREYQVGQLVQGTVTKLTKFGAFARLVGAEEIEGLIHISEFADTRVAHPRDVVAVGDVVTLRIIKLDPNQRRMGLSIKEVDSARYADLDWKLQQEAVYQNEPAAPTIGDSVGYVAEDDAAEDAADEFEIDDESEGEYDYEDEASDEASDEDTEDGDFDDDDEDDFDES